MSINQSGTHHSFDIELATKYGIQESIIIHHFKHWIGINQRLKRNFHEGRTWTYQTFDEIAAHFPYMSKSRVFDIIEKLCTGKHRKSKKETLDFDPVLLKGNFNNTKYDRTIWYAFIEEPPSILGNPNIDVGKSQNGDWDIPTPIPDTKPDAKTDKTPPNPQKGEAPKGACDKLPFGTYVLISKADYEKFCSDFGKDATDDIIEEMNDYFASSGKKQYKDFAAAIRQWMRRRKQDPKSLVAGSSNSVDKDKKLAQQIEKRYPSLVNAGVIIIGYNYIEFNTGAHEGIQHFLYGSAGFRDRCIKYLRHMMQNVEGL